MTLKPELFLPIAQGTLCAGASLVYFYRGDWKHGLYWFFAAGISAIVTAF